MEQGLRDLFTDIWYGAPNKTQQQDARQCEEVARLATRLVTHSQTHPIKRLVFSRIMEKCKAAAERNGQNQTLVVSCLESEGFVRKHFE